MHAGSKLELFHERLEDNSTLQATFSATRMRRARPTVAGIILLVLIAQVRVDIVHSFAVSSSQSPKRKRFTNQGKAAGGFAKTRLRRMNGIRGLYATKSFKKNEIICKIPSDVALALSDPSMAREQTTNPTPDFYSDAEIDELESPMIVNSAKEEKQQISDLSQSMNISFDELQFATWLVSSRLFAIKISVDDPLARSNFNIRKAIRVLLPYLDMINHSLDDANAELHLIDPEKDDAWFAIRAVRPIKNGKEITISYGASGLETSAGLLMNYGFVPNQNKIDSLLVQKGGDGCIESLDRWKTTLDEDEAQLSVATGTWSMC
ncbi:LOW QUALITY PROTEIN: hypothetical protein HJC23_006950 [Cyclotella cryptica]|uniref:SET domain-containing protein n=1 Tax=Cyclotella cryptica TaxID=29204 RepID=A0ABD3QLQ2_9STRA